MAFDGTEGEQISLNEAASITANHRSANPNGVWGHFMGKEILMAILNQSGCVGIRCYHAIGTDGNKQLVYVGVDQNENDIITGIIADRCKPCPSFCSVQNPLNS